MYEEILIPTDGIDASMAAVERGVEPAGEFDATVQFRHVVNVGTEMSASGVGHVTDELSTTLEKMATDALDVATARLDVAGVRYERNDLEDGRRHVVADALGFERRRNAFADRDDVRDRRNDRRPGRNP